MRARPALLVLCAAATALSACGTDASGATGSGGQDLSVSPQNTTLLTGINRISVALLDAQRNPVSATGVSMQIVNATGHVVATRPLQNIGPVYGGIPVYVGVASFPDVGQYQYVVTGTTGSGRPVSGAAYVTVSVSDPAVAVGKPAPQVHQAILGDPGVTIASIDSGVPPDDWHSATVAQGIAGHRPMVLYFGDPAYCPTKTCGPTRMLLQQLCTQYCGQLLFEHVETYYPAGPPGPNAHVNPAFDGFGLQTDPWVYFVNAAGVVSDRFEGPVTLDELQQSAKGTLQGKVPAVTLQ
jgi:hypothetical protein